MHSSARSSHLLTPSYAVQNGAQNEVIELLDSSSDEEEVASNSFEVFDDECSVEDAEWSGDMEDLVDDDFEIVGSSKSKKRVEATSPRKRGKTASPIRKRVKGVNGGVVCFSDSDDDTIEQFTNTQEF